MGFFNFFGQGNINQGVEEYKATPGAVLLDVRTISEYREGHIPGSKNVPLQQLEKAAPFVCILLLRLPQPSGSRDTETYGIHQSEQHRWDCRLRRKGGTIR